MRKPAMQLLIDLSNNYARNAVAFFGVAPAAIIRIEVAKEDLGAFTLSKAFVGGKQNGRPPNPYELYTVATCAYSGYKVSTLELSVKVGGVLGALTEPMITNIREFTQGAVGAAGALHVQKRDDAVMRLGYLVLYAAVGNEVLGSVIPVYNNDTSGDERPAREDLTAILASPLLEHKHGNYTGAQVTVIPDWIPMRDIANGIKPKSMQTDKGLIIGENVKEIALRVLEELEGNLKQTYTEPQKPGKKALEAISTIEDRTAKMMDRKFPGLLNVRRNLEPWEGPNPEPWEDNTDKPWENSSKQPWENEKNEWE